MAEEAKALGNAAFKEKKYDEAIEHFTTAIEADPTNHVLYSNRSGAHAAKSSFTEALLDANKCIELKSDWAKGHSRRGAAYFGLKNWPQAQSAYEKGLELDPSSQVMKDELEKVKLRRSPAARNAAAGNMPSGSSGPVTTGVAPGLSFGALLAGALYAVPILGAGRALQFYRLAIVNILLLFAANLWNAFPKSFSTLSDPKFRATQECQAFVLCLFMLMSPPMPFALMPFMSVAFLNVITAFSGYLSKLPGFLRTRAEFFLTPEGVMSAQAFGTVSEVIVTFMSPMLVVVQGYRAALLGFFYFQYVARRYKSNAQTVQVVQLLVERVDGISQHRLVPAPVQQVYTKAKSLIAMAADRFGT